MTRHIPTLFEGRRVRISQWLVVAIVLLALVIDGVDVALLSFVTPLIVRDWGVDQVLFAPALAAAVVGMALGASAGGWLGDRYGRKPVLVLSTLSFGMATAVASMAEGVGSLTVLRFLSGLGFGAATPTGFALVAEWLPARFRPRAIGLLTISAPLGGLLGAALTLAFLPALGWRGCFILCGCVTIMLGLVMLAWLPESISYLFQRNRLAKAQAELRRIAGIEISEDAMQAAEPDESATTSSGRPSIFTRELLRLNLGAQVTFFAIGFVIYAVSSWLPTVLTTAGLSLADAIRGALFSSIFAILGALVSVSLIDIWGSRKMLLITIVASFVFFLVIFTILFTGAALHHDGVKWLLFLSIGLSGGTTGGATSTMYSVLAFGYPLDRRATGLGFGVMAARTGGLVTILASGFLLRMGGPEAAPYFMAILIALAVAAVAAFIIDRHIPAAQLQSRGGGAQ